MGVVLHESKLSPYPREPHRVSLIQLPVIGRRYECLGGEILPIARPYDPVNFTKGTLSNAFIVVVDEPLAESLGFTGRFCCCFAVQAKSPDGRNLLALLSCFLAPVDNARKFSM